ncbi:MAG TPA: hypothetical protein VEQ37_17595 [Actinomycetota bacterium]|nr:hypothetical protein [Actinomycetota bacterium]
MVRVHPGPPDALGGDMGEGKKRGKIRKFFLFAFFAGLATAAVQLLKRRRGAGSEESEWQELPPPGS